MLWDLLEVSIPAVVLLPLVGVGVVLWMCFQQSARSSDVRRTEFQRLQRLAMEEHDRAERELEREYMRHKQGGDPHGSVSESHQAHQTHRGVPDPYGVDIRRRGPPGNGYGNMDIGLGEWRDPEGDSRRRKQAEEQEQRRKQTEALLQRRQQAEAEEFRKKQEEIADRKRRENLEEEMRRRRQAEDQEWQRRRADLEAQARKEAEEERRRQAVDEEKQRRLKQEPVNISPRNLPPMAGLNCVVCHKPTKTTRRCSRCKSMNYCSRECQVQHWNDGHKFECRPHNTSDSPRGSIDGDTRNFSDFSPRG